ncbi:MAG: hypothetical protein PHG97_02335 [Candidatus Margulisbacteria bacterium]|nr:hypothetical protein [Candidatus Margulisiibacteriota bacterium]
MKKEDPNASAPVQGTYMPLHGPVADQVDRLGSLLGIKTNKASTKRTVETIFNELSTAAQKNELNREKWNQIMNNFGRTDLVIKRDENFSAIVCGNKDADVCGNFDRAVTRMYNTMVAFSGGRRGESVSSNFHSYINNTRGFIYVNSADQIEAGSVAFDGNLDAAYKYVREEYGTPGEENYDPKLEDELNRIRQLSENDQWEELMSLYILPRVIAKIEPGEGQDNKIEAINEMFKEIGRSDKRGETARGKYHAALRNMVSTGVFSTDYVFGRGILPPYPPAFYAPQQGGR